MLEKYPKLLAIDFGTERIGLALSFGSLADPLTIIPNDTAAISYITTVLTDYNIERVIIGVSEGAMAEKTRQFMQQLQHVTKVPIVLADETLSTQAVRKKLKAAGKNPDQLVDHLAAAEFLQEWIDTSG